MSERFVHACMNGAKCPTAFTSDADYRAAVAVSGSDPRTDECIVAGTATDAPGELLIAIYVPDVGMVTARLTREAIDLLAGAMADVMMPASEHPGGLQFGTLQ